MKKLLLPDILTHGDRLRFARLAAPPNDAGCRLWRGTIIKRTGYGRFRAQGLNFAAHRVAFAIANGYDPGELRVLHTCDTPPCVETSHLFDGTDADNAADKLSKGRQARGERHGRAKLSDSEVAAIRAAHGRQCDLARRFGVSRKTVWRIINGLSRSLT